MTMHLAQGLTTTRTKTQKRKITKREMEKFREDLRLFNKRMKQQGRHEERMTFEEYVNYIFGKPQKSAKTHEFKALKSVEPYRRETIQYPSLNILPTGACPKPEPKVYTGTLIKGVATMHKSNAVPVIDDEYAKDIARMRRG